MASFKLQVKGNTSAGQPGDMGGTCQSSSKAEDEFHLQIRFPAATRLIGKIRAAGNSGLRMESVNGAHHLFSENERFSRGTRSSGMLADGILTPAGLLCLLR
ncbi:hypothetical protein Q8A67_020283 [Cirrhinus molitorella]|uniref:Uncharacterized protein n=1 Tax=Cirrhinus molitorella TaxID=172907 RepID=A0AA88TNJ1_9TELE|nr:hypothetical protein Q8A67_020283 [Cirrhinus molitorella]